MGECESAEITRTIFFHDNEYIPFPLTSEKKEQLSLELLQQKVDLSSELLKITQELERITSLREESEKEYLSKYKYVYAFKTPKERRVKVNNDLEKIRKALVASAKERAKNFKDDIEDEIDDEIDQKQETSKTLSEQISKDEKNKHSSVRKENIFSHEVTQEEKHFIEKRVKQQQLNYQLYEMREKRKKYSWIRRMHPYISNEEADAALELCNNDEDDVATKLTDFTFLQQVRKKVTTKSIEKNILGVDVIHQSPNKRNQLKKSSSMSNLDENGKRKKFTIKKLKLDDALKQSNTFEGWSEARVRAYKLIESNPNAYYYRFNAPNVPQNNGKWTKEEKDLFFKRMKEVGVNHKWGIFSMSIPGRVGYQCSNFYRQMIESGEIKDPNYSKENGKWVFKRKKDEKSNTDATPKPINNNNNNNNGVKKNSKRKKKNKSASLDIPADDDDDDYQPTSSYYKRSADNSKSDEDDEDDFNKDNPLPGFIDSITLEEVIEPAISPSGHVMSKSSWSRCLTQEPKNICPFTKSTLRKRDLVVLTWENIDQYREKIVNWPTDS